VKLSNLEFEKRPSFSITQLPNFPITQLFRLFVRRVLPAPAAEFLHLQPVRRGLPVLGGRIIPLFAITALHCNDLSGHIQLLASGS
jgi:hypothetical protein